MYISEAYNDGAAWQSVKEASCALDRDDTEKTLMKEMGKPVWCEMIHILMIYRFLNVNANAADIIASNASSTKQKLSIIAVIRLPSSGETSRS